MLFRLSISPGWNALDGGLPVTHPPAAGTPAVAGLVQVVAATKAVVLAGRTTPKKK